MICLECGRQIEGPRALDRLFWTRHMHADCMEAHKVIHHGMNSLPRLVTVYRRHPQALEGWRGRFPHVICRLELSEQLRGNHDKEGFSGHE